VGENNGLLSPALSSRGDGEERGCSNGFLLSPHQEREEVGASGGGIGIGRKFGSEFFGEVIATRDEVVAR
jgi:hypothetical protein